MNLTYGCKQGSEAHDVARELEGIVSGTEDAAELAISAVSGLEDEAEDLTEERDELQTKCDEYEEVIAKLQARMEASGAKRVIQVLTTIIQYCKLELSRLEEESDDKGEQARTEENDS